MPIRETIAQCFHFKLNGQRCGSPAILGERYCHWHKRVAATTKAHVDTAFASVLLLEDADSIQAALIHIVDLLLRDQVPLQKARTILKAIELASRNVKNLGVALSTDERALREVNFYEHLTVEEQANWMDQRIAKRQQISAERALAEEELKKQKEQQNQETNTAEQPATSDQSGESEQTIPAIHAVADSCEWDTRVDRTLLSDRISVGCTLLSKTTGPSPDSGDSKGCSALGCPSCIGDGDFASLGSGRHNGPDVGFVC
jgi:hypothetical protein